MTEVQMKTLLKEQKQLQTAEKKLAQFGVAAAALVTAAKSADAATQTSTASDAIHTLTDLSVQLADAFDAAHAVLQYEAITKGAQISGGGDKPPQLGEALRSIFGA